MIPGYVANIRDTLMTALNLEEKDATKLAWRVANQLETEYLLQLIEKGPEL